MLVISRKVDEAITIGGHIVVTILAIEGDRIKIGIDAPRELTILRQEVHQAVQDQERIEAWLAQDGVPAVMAQLRGLLASEAEDA